MRSRVSPGEGQCKQLDGAWVLAGFTSASCQASLGSPFWLQLLSWVFSHSQSQGGAASGPGPSDSRAPSSPVTPEAEKAKAEQQGAPGGRGQGRGLGLPGSPRRPHLTRPGRICKGWFTGDARLSGLRVSRGRGLKAQLRKRSLAATPSWGTDHKGRLAHGGSAGTGIRVPAR